MGTPRTEGIGVPSNTLTCYRLNAPNELMTPVVTYAKGHEHGICTSEGLALERKKPGVFNLSCGDGGLRGTFWPKEHSP